MEIKRDAYLQQLIERKDNGMIKIITINNAGVGFCSPVSALLLLQGLRSVVCLIFVLVHYIKIRICT